MTLAMGWLRRYKEKNETKEELVFATDSCLSAGERWKSGVKLFDLPRNDCLICFAGDTSRTYPLILNLINAIKYDQKLSDPSIDISDLIIYITTLFTELCHSIDISGSSATFEQLLGEFNFLFGGWSWKKNKFILSKIEYNHSLKSFVADTQDNERISILIGDNLDEANKKLTDKLIENNSIISGNFDIEHLQVLLDMIKEAKFDSIDGSIQFAKIYPPGNKEFFGVMWPNEKGKKTFLGKDVNKDNNPNIRYIDPENGIILGNDLPKYLNIDDSKLFAEDEEFILYCYSKNKYELKDDLTELDKQKLLTILKEIAYKKYIETNNQPCELEEENDE